jgi:hypothetical protein
LPLLTLSTSLVYVLGEENEPNLKINSYLFLCVYPSICQINPALVLLRVLSYVGLNIIQVSGVVPHHLWTSKIRFFLCHAMRTELLLVSWAHNHDLVTYLIFAYFT